MPKGRRPRGVTPRPWSGAVAESARLWRRRNSEVSYPVSEVRGGDERSYPASEVRGSGREELPHAPMPEVRGGGREVQIHVQGAMAARAQEGLENPSKLI